MISSAMCFVVPSLLPDSSPRRLRYLSSTFGIYHFLLRRYVTMQIENQWHRSLIFSRQVPYNEFTCQVVTWFQELSVSTVKESALFHINFDVYTFPLSTSRVSFWNAHKLPIYRNKMYVILICSILYEILSQQVYSPSIWHTIWNTFLGIDSQPRRIHIGIETPYSSS